MKPSFLLVLLFAFTIPLYAQISAGSAVFVPEVTGTGYSPEDNSFITLLLKKELGAWGLRVINDPSYADFFIYGTLVDTLEDSRYLFYYIFTDQSDRVIYEYSIYYLKPDEVSDLLSISISSFLSMQISNEETYTAVYAQIKGARLYIPEITGKGISMEDDAVLVDLLVKEMEAWGFILTDYQEEADYFMPCRFIAPGSIAEIGMASVYGDNYTFYYSLQDKDDIILYERLIHYTEREEGENYLRNSLSALFSTLIFVFWDMIAEDEAEEEVEPEPVPVIIYVKEEAKEADDSFRNQNRQFGLTGFWAPRVYTGINSEAHLFNFGFALSVQFYPANYISDIKSFFKNTAFGTGLEFFSDWVIVVPEDPKSYRNSILQIPLVFTYVFKPGKIYNHEATAGIQFNIPFYTETLPPLLSWRLGFQYGVKAGLGIFYIEGRFSMDLGQSGLNALPPDDLLRYNRYMVYAGIGYKRNFNF